MSLDLPGDTLTLVPEMALCLPPVASFTKEANPRLAKRPLKKLTRD